MYCRWDSTFRKQEEISLKMVLKQILSKILLQSKNTYLLKDMAGVKSNDSAYTAIKSVTEILQEDYLKVLFYVQSENPLALDCRQSKYSQ